MGIFNDSIENYSKNKINSLKNLDSRKTIEQFDMAETYLSQIKSVGSKLIMIR